MATMTMVEWLKSNPPPQDALITRLFVEDSILTRFMPFETNPQLGVMFNKRATLGSTAARAVGETYTASTGTLDPVYEPHKIYGGTVEIDRIQRLTDTGRYDDEVQAKAESAIRNFTADLINGDSSSDPRVLNGMVNRLTDTTKNHLTQSAGAATINNVIRASQMLRRPQQGAWLMGEGMVRRFTLAAHTTTVGGYITRGEDALGRPITMLANMPIIDVGRDENDALILDFTEASSTTSIYCVSFGGNMFHGSQITPPAIEDLGRTDDGTQYKTLVEWPAAPVYRHDRCAVRYSGITDVAVTL